MVALKGLKLVMSRHILTDQEAAAILCYGLFNARDDWVGSATAVSCSFLGV